MNLDIFNNIIKSTKENGIIDKFINELNEFLEQNKTRGAENELSLLQKIDNEGKVTVNYRDKMSIERAKLLRNYANETSENGDMYFIYNKDLEENMYHISICEKGKSHIVIEAKENELPKGAGVDSVLRKVAGKYVLDKKATEDIEQQMSEMVDELLEEQKQWLNNWRQEGHFYRVTENTGDKIWLVDTTSGSENGECIDDIEFPEELMDIAKEGTIFQYQNGEYVN